MIIAKYFVKEIESKILKILDNANVYRNFTKILKIDYSVYVKKKIYKFYKNNL